MVAYFKRENNLFMLFGALIGLGFALLGYRSLSAVPGYFKLFFVLLPMFVGVVLGRIAVTVWARTRLKRYHDLLLTQLQPRAFLDAFTPVVDRTSKMTIEYVDGKSKLAYAYEAMGDFEKALKLLSEADPDILKLHVIHANALLCNQKLRLYLLLEQQEKAKDTMETLQNLEEVAQKRVPTLSRNLKECIHLAEAWLAVLEGNETDEDYLREEIQLAKNDIHKSEMQLLLARAYLNRGETEKATDLLAELAVTAKELYAGEKAAELLHEN